MRRYSEHEIDEHVLADQVRRADARRNDPAWRLVEAEDGLPGLVWQRAQDLHRAADSSRDQRRGR